MRRGDNCGAVSHIRTLRDPSLRRCRLSDALHPQLAPGLFHLCQLAVQILEIILAIILVSFSFVPCVSNALSPRLQALRSEQPDLDKLQLLLAASRHPYARFRAQNA